MLRRVSNVGSVTVTSISFSSILEIGDSKQITPFSQALAVKREYPLFFSNEGNFGEFSVFTRPIANVPITETLNMAVFNENPRIDVDHVRVLGIASSSVVQIGNTDIIKAESRIKHIRQLQRQYEREEE